MKFVYAVAQDSKGQIWFKSKNSGRAKKVCTVLEASQILQLSTRQVYRNIKSGRLILRGQLLRELLIDLESVEKMKEKPLSKQPVPGHLQFLFPEHDIRDLNVSQDQTLILSRALESGTMQSIHWLLKRYSKKEVVNFLQKEGDRTLSPRSNHFWRLIFQLPATQQSSWRQISNPWLERP